MTVTIDGTTGVSLVQDGVVTAADLSSTLDLTGKTVTLPAGTGGKVLQVVSTTRDTRYTTTSTSFVDPDSLSLSITPSNTTSKILLQFQGKGGSNNGNSMFVRLEKNGTAIATVSGNDFGQSVLIPVSPDQSRHYHDCSISYLDSPATTSAITYNVAVKSSAGGTVVLNGRITESNIHGISTLTAMEIAG